MVRKLLACTLAVLLVFGLAMPSQATRREHQATFGDQETRVIVQLDQNPVLTHETMLKERGAYTVQGIESYASTLEKGLDSILSQAKSKGIRLQTEARYTHVFFGFSGSVPFSQIAELEKLPGVKKVFPDLPVELPYIDYTVPQTGAPALWNLGEGYTGEGMIVSIIDTGVDYEHLFLQDYSEYPEVSSRVIGGWNFTEDRTPDDPMDGHGHGTHVAGIVASDGSPLGYDDYVGMAPEALLYAVKVLSDAGRGYSSWVISGIEWSVNPDGDLPRADVINMSLGASGATDPNYPTCLAANAAAEAGVIVAASAGNDGQDIPTASAPSLAPKVISVASYGEIQTAYLVVDDMAFDYVTTCNSPSPDGLPHGIVHAGIGNPEDFEGIGVEGKIALIQRGVLNFTEKVENAADAGAIAAIIYNNQPSQLIVMGGDFPIPTLFTLMEIGELILGELDVDPDIQVSMHVYPPEDLISDFSSAGPANDYSLKPDISAPGDLVFSLGPGNSIGVGMGGTSMACPHVAGGAALLKQLYGDLLSVDEYKALLMNTAGMLYDEADNPYPVTTQGAGYMDLQAAILSRGIALPSSLSLRVSGPENVVTVRNLGDEQITYNIEFVSETLQAAHPQTITVAADSTSEFVINFDLKGLAEGHHQGYVRLVPTTPAVDDGGEQYYDTLSVPVYYYEGTHQEYFIVEFETPDYIYTGQSIDVLFNLSRNTTYLELSLLNLGGEYWDDPLFVAEGGITAGIWAYHDLDLSFLEPGHYLLQLYAEIGYGDMDFTVKYNHIHVVEPVKRLSGSNRFATGVAISRAGWDSADTVILARADEFADSLAGVGLSKKLDAPILLTSTNKLDSSVQAEITRLGATKVVILGGTSAVSEAIVGQLPATVTDIERVGGSDRFATAAKIAEKVIEGSGLKIAIIVYGRNFPDALAVAPVADGCPILMVEKNSIPSATADFLEAYEISESWVIGGTSVISEAVQNSLPGPTRLSGSNRYQTAVKIAEASEEILNPSVVCIASGEGFADALCLGALAAKANSCLLLVSKNAVPSATAAYLESQKDKLFYIAIGGGNSVVSVGVESALQQFLLPE